MTLSLEHVNIPDHLPPLEYDININLWHINKAGNAAEVADYVYPGEGEDFFPQSRRTFDFEIPAEAEGHWLVAERNSAELRSGSHS